MNVLIQAASHGIRVEGATLYSTSFPCSLCAKMIINGGIRRVVAQSDYADPLAKELLAEAKVKTEIFDHKSRRTKRFPMPGPAGAGDGRREK
jgi:dCMP deaminase